MMTTNRKKQIGIYIHIPFCVSKCKYCDFLSFEDCSENLQAGYVGALVKEITWYGEVYRKKNTVNSIFIGGGTPSFVDHYLIKNIMEAVFKNFEVDEDAEITIEANPGTLTEEKLAAYRMYGINRLSIGVQSINDECLLNLGRIHNVRDFMENYKMARAVGFKNINIDLMFAVPWHTKEIWESTLKTAIELEPEHISFYSLQLEEGTLFYEMFKNGKLELVSDDIDREMYHKAISLLKEGGYEHYEISNAAKKGYTCRHNLKYWSMEEYLGLGLGAHSFVDGVRFSNEKNIKSYIEKSELSQNLTVWQHKNTTKDNVSEYIFTGMRKTKGISLTEFEDKFGASLFKIYSEQKKTVCRYIDHGYLKIDGDYLKFTEKGIDISNKILAEFV